MRNSFNLITPGLRDSEYLDQSIRRDSASPLIGNLASAELRNSARGFRRAATEEDATDTTDGAKFWWNATVPSLKALISGACYSLTEQQSILSFYRKFIVGSLGPRSPNNTTCWRSYMTDDFTPIEFSWNWGLLSETVAPMIRFSIEAIGRDAGSSIDPWNWNESFKLIERLAQSEATFDASFLHELGPKVLAECKQGGPASANAKACASRASIFLAFDLKGDVLTPKIYFVPFNHLATEQRSQGSIIHDLLMPFAKREKWDSLIALLNFGLTSGAKGLVPFMVAHDCVPLHQNRIKIYFRSADTSCCSVIDVLGTFANESWEGQSRAEFQELWRLVFDQDPASGNPLPVKLHETAGMLYYFEVRPTSQLIVPKVYLPVKHYGLHDRHTANALATFFTNHGPPRERWIKRYLSAVEKICSHRRLEDSSGLHTYIACSLKNGSLDLTSYINPEIYSSRVNN
jgi:DMATS type aromatic prenyltransferase